MLKLAKLLGLLKDHDIKYASDKSNNPKKFKFNFKFLKKKDTNPNNPSGPDKPKFRWKPFVWTFVIIGAIAVILYFIFGYNQPSQFTAEAITLQTGTANNQSQMVLIGRDNNQRVVNLDQSPSTQSPGAGNPNLVYFYSTSQGRPIYFSVVTGSDATSKWFDIGSSRIISTFGNTDTSKNKISLWIKANNSNTYSEITNGTSQGGASVTELSALWQYLSFGQGNFYKGSSISAVSVILSLLPWFFIILIGFFIFRSMRAQAGASGGDGIFGVGKTLAKFHKSNITFKDVAGIEEEKNELIELVDYLKEPGKYTGMGARTPRGVILYGPPGTGKTLLAKAVSGEANVPFFEVSGASFDDMFVGVGAKRVRDLFIRAKKAAPCIIFIDEIDAVAGKRGNKMIAGGSGGIADQTINQLLSEMDGFNTGNGIIVMAATNRLDSLDDAILRPGRFDRHIQVNLPDIRERAAILKIHAKNKNLSSKVNLEDIARRTPGFSGAQLENVLNEATLLTVRHNKNVIGFHEIDEAIDRVIAGPAKKSRRTTLEERTQIAYHEAGHAVAGLYAKGGDVVEKITIIPRGQAAGYTLSAPEKQELMLKRKEDLLSIVTTTLAGRAAEEIIYGGDKITSGASNDFYKVTNVVRSMVTQLGMSRLGLTQFIPSEGEQNPYSKYYSEDTAKQIDAEIDRIISEQYQKAKEIITNNRQELDLIVQCLLALETIVKPQIDYIHKFKRLPKEALDALEKIREAKLKKAA